MRRSSSDGIYNTITLVFLGLTVFICVVVALMVTRTIQPPLAFRPLTPTFPATKEIPTETATPTNTLTPLPSNTAIPTSTPRPSNTPTETPTETWTPFPTETPFPTDPPPPPTDIPIQTEAFPPTSDPNVVDPNQNIATEPVPAPVGFPFVVQDDTWVLVPNLDMTTGCAFQGVGGQVYGLQDEPILNLQVSVTTQAGNNQVTTSGSNPRFGESGWMIQHDVRPVFDTYTVELRDPNGVPISDRVQITFPGNCDQNMALINFKQVRPY